MKLQKMLMLMAAISLLAAFTLETRAQTGKVYEDMSRAEGLVFVGEQARRIAREMSGSEYEFTAEFERDIQKAVTQYAQRIGNGSSNRFGKTDLRLVLERGHVQAPTLIAAFRGRNVSPLMGLYLPWIESEYTNLETADSGAVGMFQFVPTIGERYGLSRQDLLDAGKSADAAARYIIDIMDAFKADPMKEALALLAYNRGTQRTARGLRVVLNDQNKRCSICALTADRSRVDERLKPENTLYLPRFFAAAIIGENPHVFGLHMQPLSSY